MVTEYEDFPPHEKCRYSYCGGRFLSINKPSPYRGKYPVIRFADGTVAHVACAWDAYNRRMIQREQEGVRLIWVNPR